MGLSIVSAPAQEPVGLDEAKQHCRVDVTDDDGLISGYILAARVWAEDYTRRAFMTQTWDYTIDYAWPTYFMDGIRRHRIYLPKPPLVSVSSITYVDTQGATQTLAADQYLVNTKEINGVIEPAYSVTWPSVREQMSCITVRFVCGYGTNPGDGQMLEVIRHAMLLCIGHWYENREAVNVGNIVNDLPMGVESLLFPLRVFY